MWGGTSLAAPILCVWPGGLRTVVNDQAVAPPASTGHHSGCSEHVTHTHILLRANYLPGGIHLPTTVPRIPPPPHTHIEGTPPMNGLGHFTHTHTHFRLRALFTRMLSCPYI